MAQDIEPVDIQEISLKESGSRIRMSPVLIRTLQWEAFEEGFECWGVFRKVGEFLCAPVDLLGYDSHPFQDALDSVIQPPEMVLNLRDIPPTRVLTANSRIVKFTTSWVGKEKKQLSLKLGTHITKKLGWDTGRSVMLYALAWGKVLILLSENRYNDVQEEDFTNGKMPS
ncbi:MAG: hypothetical protein JAZ16_07590 [Candidatus Thiodiazotropha taylori]|nr:hypothetical protein [Candidatus Thiodiazotropha taylori]